MSSVNIKCTLSVIFLFCVPLESAQASFNEASILGKYQMTTDPNSTAYSEYFKAMLYSDTIRQMALGIKAAVEFAKGKHPNSYIIRSGTAAALKEAIFELGKEFNDTLHDGRPVKSVVTFEDNKVTQVFILPTVRSTVIDEFTPEGLKCTMICNNKTAVLKYKRVKEFVL